MFGRNGCNPIVGPDDAGAAQVVIVPGATIDDASEAAFARRYFGWL